MTTDKFFGDVDDSLTTVTEDTKAEVEVEVTTDSAEVEAVAEEVVEAPVKAAEVDTSLTHTALGIHLDQRGRYQVVRVKYDPVSKSAGVVENIEEAAMDKMSAEEIFKLSVVREGVFTN